MGWGVVKRLGAPDFMLWPSSLSEFDYSEDEVTAEGDGEGLSV